MQALLKTFGTAALAWFTLIPTSTADVILSDFSNFEITGEYPPEFLGDWAGSGTQNGGTYDVSGGATDSFDSGVSLYFSPTDFSDLTELVVTARLLEDNAAESFVFTLVDSYGLTASATFLTNSFSISEYLSVRASFVFDADFNAASVEAWTLTGNIIGGDAPLKLSFDSAIAVPEPHVLGLLGLGLSASLIAWRRRR